MSDRPCDDALGELYRFLDGELDHGTREQISAHLEKCSPCLEAFDFHVELRRVVASRCHEEVPDDLRARILSHLADPPPEPEV